jgi:hypothetical protein
MNYKTRYQLLRIPRWLVRALSRIVGAVPGTTFGEVADMHDGPCMRCVGKSVEFYPED